MNRPSREFRAESFDLEGRLLLATVPTSTAVSVPVTPLGVNIGGTYYSANPTPQPQVVGQQDGNVTVWLTRSDDIGTAQVQVKTDPSSPAVGVNVGAVDQTVTFASGQRGAFVIVPILSGAPNPGEVNVGLTITPINGSPGVTFTGPSELKIMASTSFAPKIISVTGETHAIVLTFSKSMNPVEASNVHNYALHWKSLHNKFNLLGPTALFMPWNSLASTTSGLARLKSAHYDPATNSVTLIPKGKLSPGTISKSSLTLTQGHLGKRSGRPGNQSNLGTGLTDLEGNPINADSTPGKFSLYVSFGQVTTSYLAATMNTATIQFPSSPPHILRH